MYRAVRHALHHFGFIAYRIKVHTARGMVNATVIEKPGRKPKTLYDDSLASGAVLVAGFAGLAYMVVLRFIA